MPKVANKKAICDKLIELGKRDKDIVVLTSDSRGSASMADFARELPEQFIEVGIAEQNLVGIAAGLAAADKKPFIVSYAAFITMRSIEQVKVDVAYSNVNVKIIGISGGLSYGPLGMSHHALQDIAVMRAIPNLNIFLPADRFESANLIEKLVNDKNPTYIRVGRNPVDDVYPSGDYEFIPGQAVELLKGSEVTIIACGEMVGTAVKSAGILLKEGISARVINMHTIKPLDEEAVLKAAAETGHIVTLEEHSIYGGLGSAVAEVLSQHYPVPLRILGVPDEPAVTGKQEVAFKHYGLNPEGVIKAVHNLLNESGDL